MKRNIKLQPTKLFKLGNLYKVDYLLCKKDEIKICYFLGLCINNTKNKNFEFGSRIKRERIRLKLQLNNPTIVTILQAQFNKKKTRKIFWQKKF